MWQGMVFILSKHFNYFVIALLKQSINAKKRELSSKIRTLKFAIEKNHHLKSILHVRISAATLK